MLLIVHLVLKAEVVEMPQLHAQSWSSVVVIVKEPLLQHSVPKLFDNNTELTLVIKDDSRPIIAGCFLCCCRRTSTIDGTCQ